MTKLFLLIALSVMSFSIYADIDCTEYPIAPVCAEDNNTYDNSCYAIAVHNSQVFHEGACGSRSQGLDEVCYTTIENECSGGLYCKLQHHNVGTCQIICSDEPNDVCGIDGVTYESECAAYANRVRIIHEGACGASAQEAAEHCTMLVANDCAYGLHCDPLGDKPYGVCKYNVNECTFVDHQVTYCEDGAVCTYENKCVDVECTESTQCNMAAGEMCEDRRFICVDYSCNTDKECSFGALDYVCNTDTNMCELKGGNDNGTGNECAGGCCASLASNTTSFIFPIFLMMFLFVLRKKKIKSLK